jgi:hypothetical protein
VNAFVWARSSNSISPWRITVRDWRRRGGCLFVAFRASAECAEEDQRASDQTKAARRAADRGEKVPTPPPPISRSRDDSNPKKVSIPSCECPSYGPGLQTPFRHGGSPSEIGEGGVGAFPSLQASAECAEEDQRASDQTKAARRAADRGEKVPTPPPPISKPRDYPGT